MGDPHYWRCYEPGKAEPRYDDACGRLRTIERLVASHMGSIVGCYTRLDMHAKTGTLSLAVDLDFDGTDAETDPSPGKARFWSGRATTLDGADAMVTCVRGRLADFSLAGVEHTYTRYTVFFPIEFRPAAGEGTPAELVLDKVRLRESRVDGRILARLALGEPVVVHEVRDGWAKITTVDRREGWVFGEAITVPEP
jgi:hypothetical protein